MKQGKNENESRCPWCGEALVLAGHVLGKPYGKVRERRCTHCGKVLAAYLMEEGDFMSRIRKFQN